MTTPPPKPGQSTPYIKFEEASAGLLQLVIDSLEGMDGKSLEVIWQWMSGSTRTRFKMTSRALFNYERRKEMAHAIPGRDRKKGIWLLLLLAILIAVIAGAATSLYSHPAHSVSHSASKAPGHTVSTHHAEKFSGLQRAAVTSYTVKSGDTLWSIAAHVYHNPLDWHRLYELNHDHIGNPDIIYAGQVLQLE